MKLFDFIWREYDKHQLPFKTQGTGLNFSWQIVEATVCLYWHLYDQLSYHLIPLHRTCAASSAMAIPLKPLKVFAQRRLSTLTSISELLLPLVDGSDGIPPLLTPSSMSLITPRSIDGVSTLLETKYGLRLRLWGKSFEFLDIAEDRTWFQV